MPPRDPTRRRRILDVAKRHFTARGFKGTTLDAIAEEAGCAKGALYLEFADKETLLRAVVQETFAAVRERFAAEVVAISSPLARLGETLRFAYRQLAREPLFNRLMRDDAELRALGSSNEEDGRAARAQIEQLVSWVEEGIARGEIRPDVDRNIVPYAIGVLKFAPQHLAMTDDLGLMPIDRVLDGLVELFLSGLAARPVSRKRAPAVNAGARRKKGKRR
jgi:TetR/AcrR family transcriptional regulator, cholesterol catabolism regulator